MILCNKPLLVKSESQKDRKSERYFLDDFGGDVGSLPTYADLPTYGLTKLIADETDYSRGIF